MDQKVKKSKIADIFETGDQKLQFEHVLNLV